MARQPTTKGKGDKGGKAQAPTPAVAHEIVPGKFNDHDWNYMLDHDDGDEFVTDIVDELCTSVLDVIYKNYIEKQLIPYTVSQAKDAILQIIEWQFLSSDVGETDIDEQPGWISDEEPEPAVTDCWAQGSVPKSVFLKTPRSASPEACIMEEVEESEQVASREPSPEREEPTPVKPPTPVPVYEKEEKVKEERSISPKSIGCVKEKKVKRRSFKRHRGPLKMNTFDTLTESLDDTEKRIDESNQEPPPPAKTPDTVIMRMPASCQSILKLQAGRPPGNRDVQYDHSGKVISVGRIKPERIPSHRIRTGFKIVDPDSEEGQQRLEAFRSGGMKPHKPKPPKDSEKNSIAGSRRNLAGSNQTINFERNTIENFAPLPPPLIEFMTVGPGVTVKEGERVKRGARQFGKKLMEPKDAEQKMLTMTDVAQLPTVTVQELLQHQTPHIRRLNEAPVIPAIPKSHAGNNSIQTN